MVKYFDSKTVFGLYRVQVFVVQRERAKESDKLHKKSIGIIDWWLKSLHSSTSTHYYIY